MTLAAAHVDFLGHASRVEKPTFGPRHHPEEVSDSSTGAAWAAGRADAPMKAAVTLAVDACQTETWTTFRKTQQTRSHCCCYCLNCCLKLNLHRRRYHHCYYCYWRLERLTHFHGCLKVCLVADLPEAASSGRQEQQMHSEKTTMPLTEPVNC